MRTESYQHSVSPHVSSNERKTAHRSPRRIRSLGGDRNNVNNNNVNNNSDSFETSESANNSGSEEMGIVASPESESISTSATEYSTSFFPEATFGESVFRSKNRRSQEDQLELLERIERILRFSQKRLKKSKVEGFYEKKKKRNAKQGSSDGGILHVQHSDVKLDSILGNGSYNVVYSVKKIKGSLLDPREIVVKTLRSKLLQDLPMLAACAADLRKEGLLLAALQEQPPLQLASSSKSSSSSKAHCHPGAKHVLRCLAWSPTGLSAFANGCHDSFFLVLEKLDRTLTESLREWRVLETNNNNTSGDNNNESRQQKANRGFRRSFQRSFKNSGRSLLLSSVKNSFFKGDSQKQLDAERDESTSGGSHSHNSNSDNNNGRDPEQVRFWKFRLGLLVDLCSAISFLHSQRVIHRDLKPDNVGFDKTGKLKVFDFDVARILPNQANWGDYRNENFKMTRKVGSPRYMSPEVARGEHYNEKSDVYALGLLAYEVLSLKRPFDTLASNDRGGKGGNVYEDCVQVVVRGEEPPSASDHRSGGRKQKRRNSLGSFPFPRRGSNGGDNNNSSNGSSGKFGSIFSRQRSHSRGANSSNSKKNTRRNPPKYANIRPRLPVMTPHELAVAEQQQRASSSSRKNSDGDAGNGCGPARKPVRCSSLKSNCSSSIRSHHHSVNDIERETTSFFWTKSLRTTIDQTWSYDIPTRPFASELKVLIGEELERIEWNEEDYSSSSNIN